LRVRDPVAPLRERARVTPELADPDAGRAWRSDAAGRQIGQFSMKRL
jgi:hypothetical protein